jgi:MFS family permease
MDSAEIDKAPVADQADAGFQPGKRPSRDIDPSGLSGLTLYEQKCILVNREINRQGMGRYQWYIWGLCGFGYLLDLLWAQAFGLVLSPLQQELGFGDGESGNISTSFNAGMTAGAFIWGVLADIIGEHRLPSLIFSVQNCLLTISGRRWAFNLTCLIASVFGMGLGGAPNYQTFLVLTAFVGLGIGGNIPIDTTITLEFIPQVSHSREPMITASTDIT